MDVSKTNSFISQNVNTGLKVTDSSELAGKISESSEDKSFGEMLTDSIKKVESLQRKADTMTMDLATGKSDNITETMIAVSKAEIAFQLMTQVRNKAINAYNEIMKMQV